MSKFFLALAVLSLSLLSGNAADLDHRLFEIRTITPNPGKWKALNDRFKNHVVDLYPKYGATTIGYFVPADGKTEKVTYILAFKDHESRNEAMEKVAKDEAFNKAFKESEKNGPLAKTVASTLLTATEFSPFVKAAKDHTKKTFELRTYTTTKGNIIPLCDRFKNHTVKLFEKHGMTNVGYWIVANVTQPTTNPLPAESTLIYLLAHESEAAAKKSFEAFRADPVWVKAKAESEKKAGGSLTEAKNGIVSEFLKLAEYSPKK